MKFLVSRENGDRIFDVHPEKIESHSPHIAYKNELKVKTGVNVKAKTIKLPDSNRFLQTRYNINSIDHKRS